MRALWTSILTSLTCVSLHTQTARATDPLPPGSVLLPPYAGICDTPLTAAQQKIVNATAFMVPKSRVTDNGNGTYSISESPLVDYYGDPINPTSNFYGIPSAKAGRTAVMLGRTTFITASHAFGFNPSDFAIVFAPNYNSSACSEFQWNNIPAANVYMATSSGTNNLIQPNGFDDYVTFNVDRYVENRKPVKIRRSGSPRPTDDYILVSNPLWSGIKLSSDAEFAGLVDIPGSAYSGQYMFSSLYPLNGSSGASVYNLTDEVIDVGIAQNVSAAAWWDGSYINFLDFGHAWTTNTPLVWIKNSIPRTEILVEPISDVVHIGDIGGGLTNSVTNYTLTAALGGNQYEIVNNNPNHSGAPTLTTNPAPGSHLLSLVNPTNMTISVNSSQVSECGIWDYVVNVRDIYNEQNNYLRHRFEIGAKEIEVEGSEPWNIEIFGPSIPANKTLLVKNIRPAAAEVRVGYPHVGSPTQLVLFDGGISSDFTLAPQGQPGDSKSVVLSLNPSATFPTPGSSVSFDVRAYVTDLICSMDPPLDIPVTLKIGSQVSSAVASGDDLLPPAGGTGLGPVQTLALPMSGTNGWCVTGINLDVGFFDDWGTGSMFPSALSRFDLVLESPLGVRSHLWNLNSIPPGSESAYLGSETVSFWGFPFDAKLFHLNASSAPPLGPDSFSVFSGVPVTGNWKLEMRRGGSDTILTPSHARIRFIGQACP